MSGKQKIFREHAGLYRLLMGDNKLKYKDSYLDSSLTSVFESTSIAVGNMQESVEDGVGETPPRYLVNRENHPHCHHS